MYACFISFQCRCLHLYTHCNGCIPVSRARTSTLGECMVVDFLVCNNSSGHFVCHRAQHYQIFDVKGGNAVSWTHACICVCVSVCQRSARLSKACHFLLVLFSDTVGDAMMWTQTLCACVYVCIVIVSAHNWG